MFKKLDEDPTKDPSLAVLEYRNTPIDKDLKSPNEIMFDRKVKGLLSRKIDYHKEKENLDIKNKLIYKQTWQKSYYDKNAIDLKPLKKSDY